MTAADFAGMGEEYTLHTTFRWRQVTAAVCLTWALSACGGDDGPSGPPNPPGPEGRQSTTFVGRLSDGVAAAGVRDAGRLVALGGQAAVQVCVAGTGFCTTVNDDGSFTLAANVGGDVVLVFDGPDFNARLRLDDVPRGATVRIDDIVCDPAVGTCYADGVVITPAANDAPDCSNAAARPAVLWPPNHKLVRIAIVGVDDPDGDAVVITATDVAQDEPVDAPGSGNTGPDAQLDPLAVRAERSGQGDGRRYVIGFIAEDGRGGVCNGAVVVCVPHDRGQGDDCR